MKILAILLTLFASAVWGQGPKDGNQLVEFGVQVHRGHLALTFKNEKGWHTYWINPGDSGLPLKSQFQMGKETWEPKALEWPVPKRYIEEGDILAYGYVGEYAFFYELSASERQKLEGKTLSVEAKWLVCKDICVPGSGQVTGLFRNGKFEAQSPASSLWSEHKLEQHFTQLPKQAPFPEDLDLGLNKDPRETKLTLNYSFKNINKRYIPTDLNLLTPFPHELFTFKRESLYLDEKTNTLHGQILLDFDGEYLEPPVNLPRDGKFKQPVELKFLLKDPQTGRAKTITKSFTQFNVQSAQERNQFFQTLKLVPYENHPPENNQEVSVEKAAAQTSNTTNTESTSFAFILLVAFLGGLILNVMPCVLPVISIKLFGLIKFGRARKKEVLKHNLGYSLGVVLSFLCLAIVVILLKQAGTQVGWGFQLQSPYFVGFMILFLFLFCLNLFGLFEFRVPGGNFLGNVKLQDGPVGDVGAGVLATILSTPCSAPFLGTALTFAFTSGHLVILSIFLMIGLGLAFPFILVGFFPNLIKFLPRPGAWMDHLKKFLGLALIFTIIWLYDVFASMLPVFTPVNFLNSSLAFLFFAFYMSKHLRTRKKVLIPTLTLVTLWLLYETHQSLGQALSLSVQESTGVSSLLLEKTQEGVPWEKWSVEKMDEYKQQRKAVFMDFTAKWCFNCKVNEKLVLNTDEFKDLVRTTGLVPLLADWTKHDPKIGEWLKGQGLYGIPAYFIQKKNGELIFLGETLSISKIRSHLD